MENNKLELKDICGYLPYNIMCKVDLWKTSQVLTLLHINGIYGFGEIGRADECLNEIKPLLHPMSDLTKSITVKGYNDDKPFISIKILSPRFFRNRVWDRSRFRLIYEYENSDIYIERYCSVDKIWGCECVIPFNLKNIDLLNQWHFDYRELIEAGLAVDINTLKE